MKIISIETIAKDLKAGDLFSRYGAKYWDNLDPMAVGQKVYIRTECPCPVFQEEDLVYKIIISHEKETR